MRLFLSFSGICCLSSLLLQSASAVLQAAGDIAFTAYDLPNDNFAFVALADINNGQVIFFDDEEWTGSSFDTTFSEGNVRWVNDTGSTISAGTIITIVDASNSGGTTNIGSVSEPNGGFNLGSTGVDGVFAYLGTDRSPTTFLAGIGNASSSTGLTTLSGTGLTLGTTAIDTGTSTRIEYTGARSGQGSLSNYRTLINDVSNWSAAPDLARGAFNTTTFDSIPEPASAVLLGMGFCGILFNRRRGFCVRR